MNYLLVVRDSDGAILGSQRGAETFSEQRPDHDMGPFGDRPFKNATTLKPGYSSTLVEVIQPPQPDDGITVVPPTKPPRSPDYFWNGSAVVPAQEDFREAWLDAADPQRARDRRRDAAILDLREHPEKPVDSACMLRLLGETD